MFYGIYRYAVDFAGGIIGSHRVSHHVTLEQRTQLLPLMTVGCSPELTNFLPHARVGFERQIEETGPRDSGLHTHLNTRRHFKVIFQEPTSVFILTDEASDAYYCVSARLCIIMSNL
jgi:hypothetical protein